MILAYLDRDKGSHDPFHSAEEKNMHAVMRGSLVPEQAATTRPVVSTTLYELIAAVDEAIEPGEEDLVAPIVTHLLRAGRARFLRDVDGEMLWDAQDPAWLEAEESCVLV
jgi:hypothetical protein